MAKHISKSVIEEIAYQLKRVGLIVQAYETKTASQELLDNMGSYEDFDTSGTATVDWIIRNIEDVLASYDPTFNPEKFSQQTSFNEIM